MTQRTATAGALLLGLGLLGGCAAGPDLDSRRSQVEFPDPQSAWLEQGTYPNLENLAKIEPGMTKDQLYALVGRPHFSEGLFRVRRWNYLFHIPDGQNGYRLCQYQVQYDGDMRVARGVWRNAACEQLLADALAPPAAPEPAILTQRSLDARTLFDFDSARLTASGRELINEVINEVEAEFSNPQITVVGHTDPLGSDAYNMDLSLRRAQSVRDALVAGGLSATAIDSAGAGESRQVKACPTSMNGAALRDCLQPNRRVEIRIHPGAS